MEDEGNHGNDDTRCFILSTLAGQHKSRVTCALCEETMSVFDRYPLVDGTFFLSPRQHTKSAVEVSVQVLDRAVINIRQCFQMLRFQLGQSGRSHTVFDMRVHGLLGKVPARTSHPMSILRTKVGRIFSSFGHYVLLRHLHGDAVLRGEAKGQHYQHTTLNHINFDPTSSQKRSCTRPLFRYPSTYTSVVVTSGVFPFLSNIYHELTVQQLLQTAAPSATTAQLLLGLQPHGVVSQLPRDGRALRETADLLLHQTAVPGVLRVAIT